MNDKRGLSRRSVLRTAGWLMAGAVLPVGAAEEPLGAGAVTARLSAYMSQARARELPEEVLEKARQHTLDTLAAMVSGSQLKPGQVAIRFAREQHGDRVAQVVASNVLCNPMDAAFANGILAQADETDDSHSPSQSHPGCAIVPAALAVGERFGIGGMQMLRAVVLGYDVGPRITMAVGRGGFQTANHMSTHSVSSCFGAAAAAACAAGLDAQQMRWMLDYASQQAAGFKVWQRDTEHVEKAFMFGGMPARAGVTAALLVRAGATGVDDVFSGVDNFFSVYGDESDAGVLVDKLGERYEVMRTNIKKWTVGSPIQAPLDAIGSLRKRRPFTAGQVQAVVVRVAPSEGALVDNREVPDICLQHMVAIMLIDGTVSFRAAHDPQRMQDPAARRERAKVTLVPEAQLEKELPARVAIVEVTLTDGTKLSERVDAVRGTAENPMTREEIIAKCRDLVGPVLGEARGSKLIETVLKLQSVADVRQLRALLQVR